jgi:hypothetical protein
MRSWAWIAALLTTLAGCDGDKSAKPTPGTNAVGQGKVAITSVPSEAAVMIDGDERVGRTPLTLERPAFTRLEIQVIKDGYRIHRARVLVVEDRTIKLHAALSLIQSTLIVRSGLVRGARILIDGEDRGKTPNRVKVTADRKHRLEVQKPGFQPYQEELTLAAGENREVEAMLVPAGKKGVPTGWLSVKSDLPAVVLLDGAPMGNAPLERVRLPAKRYRLELRNPKLKRSKVVKVVVRSGEVSEIDVKLK